MRLCLLCLAILGLGTGCLPPSGGGGNSSDDLDGMGAGGNQMGQGGTNAGGGADANRPIPRDAGSPVLDAARPQIQDGGLAPPPLDFGQLDSSRPVARDQGFGPEEDFGFGPEEDFGFGPVDRGLPPQADGSGFNPDNIPSCLDICSAYSACMLEQRPDFDARECAEACENERELFTDGLLVCVGNLVCDNPDNYQANVDQCFDEHSDI